MRRLQPALPLYDRQRIQGALVDQASYNLILLHLILPEMGEEIFKYAAVMKTVPRDVKHLLRIVKQLSVKLRGKPLHDLKIILISKLSCHGAIFMPVAVCGNATFRNRLDPPFRKRDAMLFQHLIDDRIFCIDRIEQHFLRLKRKFFLILDKVLQHSHPLLIRKNRQRLSRIPLRVLCEFHALHTAGAL